MAVNVGQKAPVFTLAVSPEKTVTLTDYSGKKLLLFFYPKDDTPGCTLESCAFRDAFEELKARDVCILGVSIDSLASHEKFKRKYNLPYDLGADPQGRACRQYGILKNATGEISPSNINRSTFLIDETGIILEKWQDVNVSGHLQDIWKSLAQH